MIVEFYFFANTRINFFFRFLTLIFWKQSTGRQCTSKDYVFEYTTCDANGQRWKVAVPSRDNFRCEGLPQPIRGINCCKNFFLLIILISDTDNYKTEVC